VRSDNGGPLKLRLGYYRRTLSDRARRARRYRGAVLAGCAFSRSSTRPLSGCGESRRRDDPVRPGAHQQLWPADFPRHRQGTVHTTLHL